MVEAKAVTIRTVAIIGAGALGRALANLSVAAGFETVLEDILPSKLRRAAAELEGVDSPGTNNSSRSLQFASSVEDAARNADLILDSVPDELESKLEIFSMLDRMAPPRSILLTPTRVLSIADLASCTYRAERCLSFQIDSFETGAVPGAPFCRGMQVRVIQTGETLPEVVEAVLGFWRATGLQPSIAVDPQPGIPATMQREPFVYPDAGEK